VNARDERHAERRLEWCECPVFLPCGCRKEAPVRASTMTLSGWRADEADGLEREKRTAA